MSTRATLSASSAVSSARDLANRGLIDLVDLIPFDVQFAMTTNVDISIFEVTDIVTSWMNAEFSSQLEDAGFKSAQYAAFDRVILHDRETRNLLRHLQKSSASSDTSSSSTSTTTTTTTMGVLYTAKFGGYALFTRDQDQTQSVPVGDVLEIQRTVLQDQPGLVKLKETLQDGDPTGLGQSLVDVNAYLNPLSTPTTTTTSNSNDQLQLVIIVAVGVACVAFLFLIMAIIWAWRYDRRNRQAYLAKNEHERTGSDTTEEEKASPESIKSAPVPPVHAVQYPPSDVVDGLYPESVITDDISTSLSQYYRSGLASASSTPYVKRYLSDAASVSSMESYGYSLDGYAPTIATPMPSDVPRRDDDSR